MSEQEHPRIVVENISKKFVLNAKIGGIRKLLWQSSGTDFWALKDISFSVKDGERLGIIGKNGAGKSTLLKILSRVLLPTTGEATIYGRATALLEVGTGFNPQLSGFENIFLTAALYGMGREEIASQVESIIDFAEVGQFINSPVKQYSTGMRARLGFSICAHLDPDVLMLDEVLSVGDASFQRKCLTRMNDMTGAGRTLLFVSHSLAAVTRFCDRCIWLENGMIVEDGPAPEICDLYTRNMLELAGTYTSKIQPPANPSKQEATSAEPPEEIQLEPKTPCRLVSAHVLDDAGNQTSTVRIDSPCSIEIQFDVLEPDCKIEPALHFMNDKSEILFVVAFTDSEHPTALNNPGRYSCAVSIPANLLNEGMHVLNIALVTADPLIRHATAEQALAFTVYEIHAAKHDATSRGRYARNFPGVIRPRLDWVTNKVQ